MVYYTGPNKKVTRLTKDSSPTDVPNQPLPTPTSSSSSSSSSFPKWAVWLIVGIIVAAFLTGIYYWNKNRIRMTPYQEGRFFQAPSETPPYAPGY